MNYLTLARKAIIIISIDVVTLLERKNILIYCLEFFRQKGCCIVKASTPKEKNVCLFAVLMSILNQFSKWLCRQYYGKNKKYSERGGQRQSNASMVGKLENIMKLSKIQCLILTFLWDLVNRKKIERQNDNKNRLVIQMQPEVLYWRTLFRNQDHHIFTK